MISTLPEPERRLRQYPHELSGGQCQRVMIAMALAADPDLLIADEPTTALDVTVQAEVLDVLRALRERTGTAILLITHDMGVVADIADRVVVMRRGQVVESGTAAEVFGAPSAGYTRELLAAVGAGDHARLQAVPGIGKRTAERIIVELREKVGSVATEDPIVITRGDDPRVLARDGLVGLGFSLQEAEELLQGAPQDTPPEALIAHALRGARR